MPKNQAPRGGSERVPAPLLGSGPLGMTTSDDGRGDSTGTNYSSRARKGKRKGKGKTGQRRQPALGAGLPTPPQRIRVAALGAGLPTPPLATRSMKLNSPLG